MKIVIEGDERYIDRLLKENKIRFSRKELSWRIAEEPSEDREEEPAPAAPLAPPEEPAPAAPLAPPEEPGNCDIFPPTKEDEMMFKEEEEGSTSEEEDASLVATNESSEDREEEEGELPEEPQPAKRGRKPKSE